ncbi:MAG: hypothetical protein ACRC50_11245, partial [Gaiella sp.]
MRTLFPRLAVLALAVVLGGGAAAVTATGSEGARVLVALRADAGRDAGQRLAAVGGTLVDGPLRLWQVDASAGAGAVAALRADDAVAFAQPVRAYSVAAPGVAKDPLSASEWWRGE